jgi:hypothetical protein
MLNAQLHHEEKTKLTAGQPPLWSLWDRLSCWLSDFYLCDKSGPSYVLANEVANMNGSRYYGVRVESAKYGVSFGSALAIAISYTANHSIIWAIIHGILGWLYVIYFALFRS